MFLFILCSIITPFFLLLYSSWSAFQFTTKNIIKMRSTVALAALAGTASAAPRFAVYFDQYVFRLFSLCSLVCQKPTMAMITRHHGQWP